MAPLIEMLFVFCITFAIVIFLAGSLWKTADEYMRGFFLLVTGVLSLVLGILWILFLEYQYYSLLTVGFVPFLAVAGLVLTIRGLRKIRRSRRINAGEWTTESAP